MSATSGFIPNPCGNADFADRQRALFDQLSLAEKICNKDQNQAISCAKRSHERTVNLRSSQIKRFRGKESIFKRPELPAPKSLIKVIPGYHRNPEKWTKYSFEDCPDITENSNSTAAFAFLKSLKSRKEENVEDEQMEVEEIKGEKRAMANEGVPTIVFNKKNKKVVGEDSVEKPIFRNSKVVMPVCVVGEKPKKIQQRKKEKTVACDGRNVKLGHLDEEDED